jgi:gluconolactonase
MKKLILSLLIVIYCAGCNSEKRNTKDETGSNQEEFQPFIEQIEKELQTIIDPASKVEIIAQGFDWTEGPLWIDGLGLLFSDIPPNKIYLWTKEEGATLYLTPSGYTGNDSRKGEEGSNGLLLDRNGNLVLCQHGDRRMAKMNAPLNDPKPDFVTIIDNYQGSRMNSPNDACFNRNGDLYFTDPPYGLEKGISDPSKEINFQGVYKLPRSGELQLLTDELSRPNGIAFSPDEKILYVANSDPEKAIWMAYALNDKGLVKSKKMLYDATSLVIKESGLPDGLKVDSNGNIFATGPGGVWIFNDTGKVLGKIRTGQATSNCAFGNNGTVLYITADMFVMKVNLKS